MLEKLLKILVRIAWLQKLIARFVAKLDRYTYKIFTILAIETNNGIHPKHEILNYHQFFIDNVGSDDVVLDLGCGRGENAYDIAGTAKKVIGIDLKEPWIQYAKDHYKHDNLEFVLGDVTTYSFDEQIDKIVLSNVLEHIEDRVGFLRNLRKISNVILVRVPMISRDWLSVWKKQQGLEYRLDLSHYIEYTLPDLRREFQESGWQLKDYSVQFGEFWGVITFEA